jgi:hypothetical protein
MGNTTQAKAIQQIRNQEHRQKGWNTVRQLSKPRAAGGISHILIPVYDDKGKEIGRTRIQGKLQMDSHLHSRNQGHFAQADGTPFTRPPLSTDLAFDGCTVPSEAILTGVVPDSYEKFSKALLSELQQCRDPILPIIDFEEMCYSFRKWKEKTTTSPSRKHLGIYKSLLSAVQYQIVPDITGDPSLETTPNIALMSLQIQHRLLNLAIRECHSFGRWHTVHNFFLEKIPGQPLIEKLRVIQIYEAMVGYRVIQIYEAMVGYRVIQIYEADWNFLN